MSVTWTNVLTIASVLLFGLAAFNVGSPRVQLGWAGLCCFALAYALGGR